jgi:oligopeptide/dipeptide ABC transporter ATP-binding protein
VETSSVPSARAESAAPILSVEDLRVALAVDGVSFALDAGECVAVVGESGSGKTQLARAILGLPPDGARLEGRVVYAGRDLLSLSDGQWRGVRGPEIGMVFQEPAAALDPVRTVGSHVVESIRLHRRVSLAHARRLAREALAEVALPDPDRVLDEYPHRLSGGLRQRACLAIALVAGPKVLLADEPTASLDATVAMQILELLDRLRRERGLTVLLITHDLGVVARHCDRVLVLYSGRIVEEAGAASLFGAPAHPYTQGLLRSMPRLRAVRLGAGHRHEVIAGSVEDISARHRGACAFAPRCPERFAPCDQSEPELYAVGAGFARCFLHDPARWARA